MADKSLQTTGAAPAKAAAKKPWDGKKQVVVSEEKIKKGHEFMTWPLLVSEGSVILARVNDISAKFSQGLVLAAIGAFALNLLMSMDRGLTAGSAVSGWSADQAVLNTWAGGATLKSTSPALAAATTPSAAYLSFVADVEAHPEKLAPQDKAGAQYPCVPIQSLSESWLNPATGVPDRPRCKFTRDSIFVASYVVDSSRGSALIYPVLGVFHKQAAGWAYYNFDGGLGANIFALRDRPSVSIYQIANEVNDAFPGALQKTDITAARTAWQKAKKLFESKN